MKHPASPYRTATLRAPDVPRVPRWQRLWWRIDREDALQRWSWARREHGGRWCLHVLLDIDASDGPFIERWRETETCPLTWNVYFDPRHPSTWSSSETLALHRATVYEHGRCSCEVWP